MLYALLALVVLVAGGLGFMYLRVLRLKYGHKDSNYGFVQHSPKTIPENKEDLVLPGSRSQPKLSELEDVKETLEAGLRVVKSPPQKAKIRPFNTREDIRRSYLIDALLERPKF